MRSSSQLIIFVMHKNCAFYSLAAFFIVTVILGPECNASTQQRNRMFRVVMTVACLSAGPLSDDTLQGTADVMSVFEFQALPSVIGDYDGMAHSITDKGATRMRKTAPQRAR